MTEKSQLRQAAREKRKALAAACPDFAAQLGSHAGLLPVKTGMVVGGYHALAQEADPALLLARLAKLGCAIAFPRVVAKDQPLDFHRIPDGDVLRAGTYGIPEPAAHFPRAVPDLLLVPLLAFDGRGHRLGYGGGFYDRTLEALNSTAIGIAFAGQEIASIPVQPHDRRLSAILTEHGLKRFS